MIINIPKKVTSLGIITPCVISQGLFMHNTAYHTYNTRNKQKETV